MKTLHSIGVIGGADGPTAIFVTGPDLTGLLIGAAVLAALAVGIILLIKSKK